MQPIVKFGLTKSGISSNLHTLVRYGPCSIGDIGLFDPFVIQGAGQIAFFFKHYWKYNLFSPLLWYNFYTLQLESGGGGHMFKNDYIETKKWLHKES